MDQHDGRRSGRRAVSSGDVPAGDVDAVAGHPLVAGLHTLSRAIGHVRVVRANARVVGHWIVDRLVGPAVVVHGGAAVVAAVLIDRYGLARRFITDIPRVAQADDHGDNDHRNGQASDPTGRWLQTMHAGTLAAGDCGTTAGQLRPERRTARARRWPRRTRRRQPPAPPEMPWPLPDGRLAPRSARRGSPAGRPLARE